MLRKLVKLTTVLALLAIAVLFVLYKTEVLFKSDRANLDFEED